MSGSFLDDVMAGLSAAPKTLPSKYLYDERGSALFEEITRLPEYYPTRTETALLTEIAPQVAQAIPSEAALVEFGSGSSLKTTVLLDAAPQISAYVPIDISPDALAPAAARMQERYPKLCVIPVVGDFTSVYSLPEELGDRRRVGFFPGSTIGNFDGRAASDFMAKARAMLGRRSQFVIGFDLIKSAEVLVAAYDDAQGVTAAFNLNMLTRLNRELGADFDLKAFHHRAVWNARAERMEMHLVSLERQTVQLQGHTFRFAQGETIHSESSYKYSIESFGHIARDAGWEVGTVWTSPPPSFAVALLDAAQGQD